jgi:hypothetical protein
MKLTASDRSSLIKLASSLPKGSEERRVILLGLSKAAVSGMNDAWSGWLKYSLKDIGGKFSGLTSKEKKIYKDEKTFKEIKTWADRPSGSPPHPKVLQALADYSFGDLQGWVDLTEKEKQVIPDDETLTAMLKKAAFSRRDYDRVLLKLKNILEM